MDFLFRYLTGQKLLCLTLLLQTPICASLRAYTRLLPSLVTAGLTAHLVSHHTHLEEPIPDIVHHKKCTLTNGQSVTIHEGLFPQGPLATPPASSHLFSQFCPHQQSVEPEGYELATLVSYAINRTRLWFLAHDYLACNGHSGMKHISANIDGKCVGRIVYVNSLDRPQAVYIHNFDVTEEYQGKRIGTELESFLYHHLQQHAPSINAITVVSLDAAVRFYEKNGYKKARPTGALFVKKIERPEA